MKWTEPEEGSFESHLEYCGAEDPEAMRKKRVRLGDLGLEEGQRTCREYPTDLMERLRIGDVLALSGDYLPFNEKGEQIHTLSKLHRPLVVTRQEIEAALKEEREIGVKPFADMLLYFYDAGDDWMFRISGSKGCSDLIEAGVITRAYLDQAIEKAKRERHPVLLAKDGDMLIEDIGNVEGFVEFLKHVKLSPDAVIPEQEGYGEAHWDDGGEDEGWDEEREEYEQTRREDLEWAITQGWHKNDVEDIDLL